MSGPYPLSATPGVSMSENFHVKNDEEIRARALASIKQQPSPLNMRFFSAKNIDEIQRLIKIEVFNRSKRKHVIGRQNDDELMHIMTSIFINNAVNLPIAIEQQVASLNRMVVLEATRLIMPAIEQYIAYIDQLDKPRTIMSNGQSTSIAGTKQVGSRRFI